MIQGMQHVLGIHSNSSGRVLLFGSLPNYLLLAQNLKKPFSGANFKKVNNMWEKLIGQTTRLRFRRRRSKSAITRFPFQLPTAPVIIPFDLKSQISHVSSGLVKFQISKFHSHKTHSRKTPLGKVTSPPYVHQAVQTKLFSFQVQTKHHYYFIIYEQYQINCNTKTSEKRAFSWYNLAIRHLIHFLPLINSS